MPIIRSREMLAIDLRTYGEDGAAALIDRLSDAQLQQIYDRADHFLLDERYATPSGGSREYSWALSMAAIEVIEGSARDLRRKRRVLKGIYPGY
jgi:hypothetical protein